MNYASNIKTVNALRTKFWDDHPEMKKHFVPGQRQNDYKADIRLAWVYYVDRCARDGIISNALAERATL